MASLYLGAFAVWGYAVVGRWVPHWRPGARLSAAMVVQLVSLQAGFAVLAGVGLFTRAMAAALALAALVLAWWLGSEGLRATAAADLAAARHAVASAPLVAKGLGVGLVALGSAMAVRMLVTPPMAWDDLTYHLVKAGSWAGAGSMVSTPAPDAWTYYDHFAAGGEVLHSWTMLASSSGGAIGVLSLLLWVSVAVAAHAGARGLGLGPDRAALAAVALASVPAVAVFVESAYVDNLVLFALLAGFSSLLAVHADPSCTGLLVAAAAFGLAAGAKQSMLPVAAMGWAWLIAIGWRHRGAMPAHRSLLAVAGGVAVAAPWYLRAWIDEGSPMYPFRAPILGSLLPSNAQLHAVLSGSIAGEEAADTGPGYALEALRSSLEFLGGTGSNLNWPPAPLVWLLAAVGGGAVLLPRPGPARAGRVPGGDGDRHVGPRLPARQPHPADLVGGRPRPPPPASARLARPARGRRPVARRRRRVVGAGGAPARGVLGGVRRQLERARPRRGRRGRRRARARRCRRGRRGRGGGQVAPDSAASGRRPRAS